MKPTVDYKMSSDDKMTPVQMVETRKAERKGVTGKHVLLSVVVLLCVTVVVAGFVTAFYFLKQTASENSDNLTKVFSMNVRDGSETYKENIITNVKENTTELDMETEQGVRRTLFHDYKKGLSVHVMYDGDSPRCYVSPLNRNTSTIMAPEALQRYMQTHPNDDSDGSDAPRHYVYMEAAEEPIRDRQFLGLKINALCEGKPIHWMYPQSHETSEISRQKRRPPYIVIRRCYYCSCCGCWHCYDIIIILSRASSTGDSAVRGAVN